MAVLGAATLGTTSAQAEDTSPTVTIITPEYLEYYSIYDPLIITWENEGDFGTNLVTSINVSGVLNDLLYGDETEYPLDPDLMYWELGYGKHTLYIVVCGTAGCADDWTTFYLV